MLNFVERIPAWILRPTGVTPTLDLDFQNSRYWQDRVSGHAASDLVTVSRASTGYADNLSGNWTVFGNNVLRITNKGLLVEEARTNGIRNNSMQGAVVSGAFPTNWNFKNTIGVTSTVSGLGTENGIDYIDITLSGSTNGNNGGVYSLSFDAFTTTAALYGQSWASSGFVKLQSGSLTNISAVGFRFYNFTSGSAQLNTLGGAISYVPTSATLGTQRVSATGTLIESTTASVTACFDIQTPSGIASAVSATFRIGWPQLENNNFNSSVASATVAAGGSGGSNGAVVLTVVGGSGTAATLNGTISGGVLTTINSVASAGNYSTFPPSPAAVTGGGLAGATVNLVPTNNATKVFATSPIRTTNASAARAVDIVTLRTVPAFTTSQTIFEKFTPNTPLNGQSRQDILSADDGTLNNRIQIQRNSTITTGAILEAGGVFLFSPNGATTTATGVSHKIAFGAAISDQALYTNGVQQATSASGTPATNYTLIHIGTNAGAGNNFGNCYVERVAVWPSFRLVNAALQ